MPLSSTARVHLFYQSIILIIIFWSLSYNAILPERQMTFAIFVPILLYKLLILLCWMEVLPVPDWMDSKDLEKKVGTTSTQQKNLATWPKFDEEIKNNKTPSIGRSQSFGSRTYKFRNWKSNWQEDSYNSNGICDNITAQKLNKWSYGNSEIVSQNLHSAIKQHTNAWTYPYNRNESQESTKRYFFPYRQKRCEQWIDKGGRERPYKIRTLESEKEKSDVGLQTNLDEVEITNKNDFTDGDDFNDEAGLNKSYSFPFRHKRMEEWFDKQEHTPKFTDKSTPMTYWKSTNYAVTKNVSQDRKQSAPVIHLIDENAVESDTDDKGSDFSQSVEVTSSLDKDLYYRKSLASMSSSSLGPKKGLYRTPSNSFQKITRGVAKYFSKNKENEKNIEKPTRKRSFKSIFRDSRKSSVHMNSELANKSAKFDNKDEDNMYSYKSYDKESFENDLH